MDPILMSLLSSASSSQGDTPTDELKGAAGNAQVTGLGPINAVSSFINYLIGNDESARQRGYESEIMAKAYARKKQKLDQDILLTQKFNRLSDFSDRLDKGTFLANLNNKDMDNIYNFVAQNYRG